MFTNSNTRSHSHTVFSSRWSRVKQAMESDEWQTWGAEVN